MVRHAIAANRPETFGKCADDEIHIVLTATLLSNAASILAQNAERMRFINEKPGAVLLLDLSKSAHRGDVSGHGINALNHDQLGA